MTSAVAGPRGSAALRSLGSDATTAATRRAARWARAKRTLDLAAVLLTAPATIPLALATAALVRSRLGSPVLFRQSRIGRDEAEFAILKFRTMTDATDDAGLPLPDAERLTPLGRFLRTTSLDELPQLLNVLRGEMSIIGPRPLLPRYLPHYTATERQRHAVLPGITGLAQASGRNDLLWDAALALDVEYAQHPGLQQDLTILLRTVSGVLSAHGVSVVAGDSGQPLDVVRSQPRFDGFTIRRLEPADAAIRLQWTSALRVRTHDGSVESARRRVLDARARPGYRGLAIARVGADVPVAIAEIGGSAGDDRLRLDVDPRCDATAIRRIAIPLVAAWLLAHDGARSCTIEIDSEVATVALHEELGLVRCDASQDRRVRMRLDPERSGSWTA